MRGGGPSVVPAGKAMAPAFPRERGWTMITQAGSLYGSAFPRARGWIRGT